jgi:hypothetical protein
MHYLKWTHEELGMTILNVRMMVHLMETIMALMMMMMIFDYEELLRHVEPHVLNSMGTNRGLDNMEILEKSLREPLYDESNSSGKEFTQLHVMLELLKLKASHGWSDNNFSGLLSLLSKLLLKPNTLPTSIYRANKLICLLSLGVDKIHAYPNYCILYRKEHEFKTKCLVCGVS